MNTQHTPTPWHILSIPDARELHPLVSLMSGEGRRECVVCNSCAPEDAHFIVRAVNSHERLIEACKDALENLTCLSNNCQIPPHRNCDCCACDSARVIQAALTAAEKGEA